MLLCHHLFSLAAPLLPPPTVDRLVKALVEPWSVPLSVAGVRVQRDKVGLMTTSSSHPDCLARMGAPALAVGAVAAAHAGGVSTLLSHALSSGDPAPTSATDVVLACAVLGVELDASPVEVKRAFRAKLRASHPDTTSSPTAAVDELVIARDVLLRFLAARHP